MSDLQKTVEIIFEGTDSISKTLKTMSGKVDRFGNDLADIGQPFADAAQTVLALDAAIAALAVAGIKASSDLDAEAKKMKASLGLPNEEAERFRTIAEEVYTDGFGESLTAAFQSVIDAQRRFGDNAEVDIGKVAEQALKLQKVFGTDINESMASVSTLMENFGITSDEAFDFIAAGFQRGLDGSGDFLESINEYATQFSNGGADAGEFFSVLDSGFQEGIIGTDKAADAFKEFRVRIQDESKTTNDALKSLGIDPDEFGAKMAAGETTAIEAFNIIIGKLNETEDETVKLNAGVGLMGTQFEDLGTDAALAIDATGTKIDDLAGKIDDVDVDDFSKDFVSALRTVQTEFGNLSQWDDAKDALGDLFVSIAENFGTAMENVDFTGLESAVGEVWDKIGQVFVDNDFDLTSVEGMQNAVQTVVDTLSSLADVTGGIVDVLAPMVTALIDTAEWFNELDPAAKALAGNLLGLGTALTAVGTAVSVGGALLGGLATLTGLVTPAGALVTGIAALAGWIGKEYVDGVAGAADATESFNETIKDVKDDIKDLPPEIKTEILAAIDREDYDEMNRLMNDISAEQWEASIQVEADNSDLVDLNLELNELPEETLTAITAAINAGDMDRVEALLQGVTDKDRIVEIEARADVETAKEEIEWFDEEGKRHVILVEAETGGVGAVKDEIEQIPTEKMLEIQLQGDIDTEIELIKAQAETVQTAMEWTARADIAQAEAAAEVTKEAFDTAGESVLALTEATSSMFGELLGNWEKLSGLEQMAFFDLLEDQQEQQNKLIEEQILLTQAQREFLEKKAESFDRGDALIQIDTTGVEPALEMVMWEILEKVQLRANEEYTDFLLGI